MNKISYIILAIGLVVASSCEDILEKTPDGQITLDKVLSNYGRSKGLLDVAYGEVYTARDQICFVHNTFDALSDNTFWAGTWNAYAWHNGALSLSDQVINWPWSNPSEQLWPDFWRGIRLANNAIKYIPQSSALTNEEKQIWVAEARVLRCWYYMNLLEFYGPMPWIEEPLEPTYDGWNGLTRPTYDEIATKLSEELMEVIESGILPNRQTPSEAMHVDNGVALAIRARVLINNASLLNNPSRDKEKWQRAADAAQDVLNMKEYSLVPMSDYKKLFVGAFSTPVSEIIWRSWVDNSHINVTNGVDVGTYPHATINHVWSCGEGPTQELVDCFEMKNGSLPVTYDDATHTKVTVTPGAASLGYSENPGGDPYSNRDARFYVNIVYNMANYGVPYNCKEPFVVETYVGGRNGFNENIAQGAQNSCTGYYNAKDTQVKYFGPSDSRGNEPTHWVFFRLAEFYLDKAEALCELGNLDGALNALNMIRERALQPRLQEVEGFQKNYEFIMARIRNERRIEFCMEGWRFHDQRRWKILDQTNRLVTGMRITKDDDGKFHYERKKIRDYQSHTDKYLVMPIPQDDAKKMSKMTQPAAWR